MNAPRQFDVLVVYDARLAHSAADGTYTEKAPFARASSYANCNASYQYFLLTCKRQGLQAAFATTQDIIGPGTFKAFWTFTTRWQRIVQPAKTNLVFDKFSTLADEHRACSAVLLAKPNQVTLFHNPMIRELFDDKLKTYQSFPKYTIPTVKINLQSARTIQSAKHKLQVLLQCHANTTDFTDTLVIKDQFGMGGMNIYKVTDDTTLMTLGKTKPDISFIIQPFINLAGFKFGRHTGIIDLRIIICNNAIVQSYIRIARPGEFRANAQQGGKIIYLTKTMIPHDVKIMVTAILKTIQDKRAIYALDFIKSAAGNLYFIEGNTRPGINWFNRIDELHAKHMIRLMVKNITASHFLRKQHG